MSGEMNGNGANGNGAGRIVSLDQVRSDRNATDAKGRKLRHNATVEEAHEIAKEEAVAECSKVNEYYLQQIPHFVANMINDALIAYGLIKLMAGPNGQPVVGSTTLSLTELLERLRQFEASLWHCATCHRVTLLPSVAPDDRPPLCSVCIAPPGVPDYHRLQRVEFLPKGQAAPTPDLPSDGLSSGETQASAEAGVDSAGGASASAVGAVERTLSLEPAPEATP